MTSIMESRYNICQSLTVIFTMIACFTSVTSSCDSNSAEVITYDDGIVKNDALTVYLYEDGDVSVRDENTGQVTMKKVRIEWSQDSANDSLSVFCSNGLRGFYNAYTGRIVIPAKYRRAWVFSEGLAAVQKDGNIGFLDHSGKVVIDFLFPYHGNPLTDFVFKNGVCVVANAEGKCGVIDKTGNWILPPKYSFVSAFRDYAVVTADGLRKQVGYDGTVLNSFVLDDIEELVYYRQTSGGYDDRECHYTGYFAYRTGGRWGLMDSEMHRLTEPLYSSISAINDKIFRATLLDDYSEIIINSKGETMK